MVHAPPGPEFFRDFFGDDGPFSGFGGAGEEEGGSPRRAAGAGALGPLGGPEAGQLRTLFDFVTAPRNPAARKSGRPERSFNFPVPALLKRSFQSAALMQRTSVTAVLARYVAAHNYLCRVEAGHEHPAAETRLPVPRLRPVPLKGTEGKRLQELFDYARRRPDPEARRGLATEDVGFVVPVGMHAAFKRFVGSGRMTGVLLRYMAVHVSLS